jgi:hypothetical protein
MKSAFDRVKKINSKQIALIVDQILTLKQTNPSADTSLLEQEIDLMVYELYGLSAEEIGVVEGG